MLHVLKGNSHHYGGFFSAKGSNAPASKSIGMWGDRLKKKGLDYYNSLREECGKFISSNELIAVPSVVETINTRTISLLATDLKTRKLIGVSRDVMEEFLKSLNIGANELAHRSNSLRNILLAMKEAAKSLAVIILTAKLLRLQTKYMGTQKAWITLLKVPMYITEDNLWVFFVEYREVEWDLSRLVQ